MSPLLVRWTKTTLVAAGLICIGYGVWTGRESLPRVSLPRIGGSAKIVAIPAEVDFQTQEGQSNAAVEIVLRNEGHAAATLLEVKTSCGCTAPQMPAENVLEPGAEVRLPIRLQPPPYGNKESLVTVMTDAAETPSIRIQLHLHGRKLKPPYISLAPENIRVESVIGTTPAPRKFQVSCIEAPGEQWLKGFTASSDEILLGPPELIREIPFDDSASMKEYETEISFADSYSTESGVTVQLQPVTAAEPTKPFPPIGVHWQRVGAIRPAPSSLLVTFDDAVADASRRVVLVSADQSDWAIESLDSDAAWLTAKKANEESKAGLRQIQITASKPSPWDGAPLKGRIRVHTSHPNCPEVVIRVIASGPRS